MTGRQLAAGTLATTWSYLHNTGDRRLSGITTAGTPDGPYNNLNQLSNLLGQRRLTCRRRLA